MEFSFHLTFFNDGKEQNFRFDRISTIFKIEIIISLSVDIDKAHVRMYEQDTKINTLLMSLSLLKCPLAPTTLVGQAIFKKCEQCVSAERIIVLSWCPAVEED